MASPQLGVGLEYATIISTSIEGVLYGISLALFGGTMWALIYGRPNDEINWSMALVALTLTVLSTIHLMVDVQRLVDGFITNAGIFPGGPVGFFADVTQRTFIIKNATYILQTLLGDGVVIYRCYVVWQRFGIILPPVMLWCAALATSAGLLHELSRSASTGNILLLDVGKWAIPFYSLTLATNLLSSALLTYGIWTMNRNEPGVMRILSRTGVEDALLLRVLVDAAALYILTLFALLMFCVLQSTGTGRLIVLDMMTSIISITFNTILVRIAIARSTSTCAVPVVLSPVRFAAISPSEPVFSHVRRSSI